MKLSPTTAALLLAVTSTTALAGSVEVDLDSLPDDQQISRVNGLDIGVVNPNPAGEQVARVWNYTTRPELLVGGHQTPFTVGNAADTSPLKGLAVFGTNPSIVESSRPGVSFFFNFDAPVSEFQFTIVDVEGPEEFQTDSGFSFDVVNDGIELGTVFFGDLITPGSDVFDSTIEFGNGSANQITILAADFGVAAFDRVELSLGGSGTVNNLSFTPATLTAVPTPSAAVAGLAGLALAGFRRRKNA